MRCTDGQTHRYAHRNTTHMHAHTRTHSLSLSVASCRGRQVGKDKNWQRNNEWHSRKCEKHSIKSCFKLSSVGRSKRKEMERHDTHQNGKWWTQDRSTRTHTHVCVCVCVQNDTCGMHTRKHTHTHNRTRTQAQSDTCGMHARKHTHARMTNR